MKAKAGRRHLLSHKSTKRKRNLRKKNQVEAGGKELVKKAMPYSA